MPEDPGPEPTNEPDDKTDPEPDRPDVGSLPEWAREALTKANKEAATYRSKVRELEPAAKKAKELEEAGKTESQRLADDRDGHKSRADKAESELLRLQVGLERGLTVAQAKRLVGGTKEELEADADDLLESFGGSKQDPVVRKPSERLRGGSDPTEEPEETDPAKLAAAVPRR